MTSHILFVGIVLASLGLVIAFSLASITLNPLLSLQTAQQPMSALQIIMPQAGETITERSLLLAHPFQDYYVTSASKPYIGLQSVVWSISQDGRTFTPLPQEDSNSDMIGLVTNFLDPAQRGLAAGQYYLRVDYNEQGLTGSDTIPITVTPVSGARQGGSGKCSCKSMNVKTTGVSGLRPDLSPQMLTSGPGKDPHTLGPVFNRGTIEPPPTPFVAQYHRFDVTASVDGNAAACKENQKVKATVTKGSGEVLHHTGSVNSLDPLGKYGTNNLGTDHYRDYADDDYAVPSNVKKYFSSGTTATWTDAPGILLPVPDILKFGGIKINTKFSAVMEGSEYTDPTTGQRKKGDTCRCTFDAANGISAAGASTGNSLTGTNCQTYKCGDGKHDPEGLEQCDDGNTEEGDDCDNSCRLTFCGNKIVEPLSSRQEECDDGNEKEDDTCSGKCKLTFCGDGSVQNPNGHGDKEECDDGNSDPTDQCGNDCKITTCGDGTVQAPNGYNKYEECDPPESACTARVGYCAGGFPCAGKCDPQCACIPNPELE